MPLCQEFSAKAIYLLDRLLNIDVSDKEYCDLYCSAVIFNTRNAILAKLKVWKSSPQRDAKLADYFAQELDPHEQIKVLSLHMGIDMNPDDTLIIFDEVQECSRVLRCL